MDGPQLLERSIGLETRVAPDVKMGGADAEHSVMILSGLPRGLVEEWSGGTCPELLQSGSQGMMTS